jgi:arylsulfatase
MKNTAVLIMSLIGLMAIPNQAQSQEKPQRPNILFIMTDQQRCDAPGINGNDLIQTLNIDAFAKKSTDFTHFFFNFPVCVPSRASFFTGRYPHAHKNRVN